VPLRIDCGFRNLSSWACYLVFKDRAACCGRDFLLPCASQLHPIQPRGLHSLFRSAFPVKRPLPLPFQRFASFRINIAPLRFVSSLSRGRGIYFAFRFPVNRLRRLSSSTELTSSSVQGRRLLPPPRWESTSLVDFVFRLSVPPGSSRRQCDFAFPLGGARLLPPPRWESTAFVDPLFPLSRLHRFRGRGFYHRRVESQLRVADSVFRLSTRPGASVAVATSPSCPRGRGFYHHRVQSQPPSLTPSSPLKPPRRLCDFRRFRGRGFYHRRVGSQPPSPTRSSRWLNRRFLSWKTGVPLSQPPTR
jgi:hypothetical protein